MYREPIQNRAQARQWMRWDLHRLVCQALSDWSRDFDPARLQQRMSTLAPGEWSEEEQRSLIESINQRDHVHNAIVDPNQVPFKPSPTVFQWIQNIRESMSDMAAMDSDCDDRPTGRTQCVRWRETCFRTAVLAGLGDWSRRSPSSIRNSETLGGVNGLDPNWNINSQIRLTFATNNRRVFHPFDVQFDGPDSLLSASTSVARWIEVVFERPTREFHCYSWPF